MEKIYRILLIAVCAVGILFGLQYFLPVTAQYFNIPGVSGIPGLPSMPTRAYEATISPLPLITLEITPPTPGGFSFFSPASATPGSNATLTATLVPGTTTLPTNTLAPGATAVRSATLRPTTRPASLTPAPGMTTLPNPTAAHTSTPIIITATKQPGLTLPPTFTALPVSPTVQNVGGPCYNVLYPVKPGQGWAYRVNTQGRSLQINMVIAGVNGQQADVDVTNPSSGGFSRTHVECDNGAIRSFPSIVGGLLLSNVTMGTLNIQYVSGILAPSLAAFERASWNLQWSANYTLSGNANVPFQGNNFNLALNNSPLTFTCRTTAAGSAAFEPITVTAGSFPQALKVICDAQSQITGDINGQTVSGTISGRSTQWFAPNVGLLKMQVDSANFNLLGITLPLNLTGQVELLQFQAGP